MQADAESLRIGEIAKADGPSKRRANLAGGNRKGCWQWAHEMLTVIVARADGGDAGGQNLQPFETGVD